MIDFHFSLRAGDRGVGANLDFVGGEAAQLRIVVAIGFELRQGQRAIVQDDRRGVMRREQRLEFRFVLVKAAVHVERRLTERDVDLAHARRIDLVLFHDVEQRRVQALNERRRRP